MKPDLNFQTHTDFSPLTASTTLRPISEVEIAARPFPAKSAVRAPCASTAETAFSAQIASDSS